MRTAAVLPVLVACGKKPAPPAQEISKPAGAASRYEASEAGLSKLPADLRSGEDAEVAALWRDLYPGVEDHRKFLDDAFFAKWGEKLADIHGINRDRTDKELADAWRMNIEGIDLAIERRSTEDLAKDDRAIQTHQRSARKALRPDLTSYWVCRTSGFREGCPLFFHDGSRWICTGRLYRYVE